MLLCRPTDGVLQSFTACKPQEDPENLHVNLLANTKYLSLVLASPSHLYFSMVVAVLQLSFCQGMGFLALYSAA